MLLISLFASHPMNRLLASTLFLRLILSSRDEHSVRTEIRDTSPSDDDP